jgi:hypothetical protein
MTICPIEIYVYYRRHHHGRPPKHNRAQQAFIEIDLLRECEVGVGSIARARIASDTTRAAVTPTQTDILQIAEKFPSTRYEDGPTNARMVVYSTIRAANRRLRMAGVAIVSSPRPRGGTYQIRPIGEGVR